MSFSDCREVDKSTSSMKTLVPCRGKIGGGGGRGGDGAGAGTRVGGGGTKGGWTACVAGEGRKGIAPRSDVATAHDCRLNGLYFTGEPQGQRLELELGPFKCRSDAAEGGARAGRGGGERKNKKARPLKQKRTKFEGGTYEHDETLESDETMAIYVIFVRSFENFGPFQARVLDGGGGSGGRPESEAAGAWQDLTGHWADDVSLPSAELVGSVNCTSASRVRLEVRLPSTGGTQGPGSSAGGKSGQQHGSNVVVSSLPTLVPTVGILYTCASDGSAVLQNTWP